MLSRAYSLFEIKSIDEEQRIIEGIASTPEADSGGDEMDSKGAIYTLPMPFRWHHKATVGEVIAATIVNGGIKIKATIAKVSEPGLLKDQVDYAWQSIKLRLTKGLSIGWLPVEAVHNRKGGLTVAKWRWLETSAVDIPMNSSATISLIKSIDGEFAATGTEPAIDSTTTPGVSGTVRAVKARQVTRMAKTIAEQIKDFENTRAAKAARRTEIMTKAGDDGVTLDAAQTEEYDGLDVDVKNIDAHLVRLNALEEENKKAAKPITGANPEDASKSRGGTISVKDQTPPGIGFARAIMCKMQAYKDMRSVDDIAKERYPNDPRVQLFMKAAVTAGTTADATYMGALVDPTNLASEFIEFLRPQTIIGRIPGLRRVPFNIRVIGQTTGGSGYWVGQGKAKPLTKFGVAPTTLTWAKVAAISVITDELARFSSPSAEAMVRDALAAAVIERMDIDFVDPNKAAVSGVSPASITNGITPIVSSGTEPSAVRTDFQALFAAIIADNLNPSSFVLIMPNSIAMVLSLMTNELGQPQFPGITMNGGTFMGIPVVTSQYVTDGSPGGAIIILANASDIFLSDDGQVTVDVSREASLEMDDAPSSNSGTPTAATMVSMWQTNSIALRAERYINWARRRDEAVQYLSDVSYSATGSPS